VALTDVATGLYAHGAIIAALYARDRPGGTGKGQRIDLSLLESQVRISTAERAIGVIGDSRANCRSGG
jgi:succinate--hydroxymethylglutarate CoA-transferase